MSAVVAMVVDERIVIDFTKEGCPIPVVVLVEAVGIRASRSGTGCRQSRSYATLMSKRPG